MTDLALDLRAPLIVVAGAFNPAIFSRGWLATNVFDVAPGAEMSVLQATIQLDTQAVLTLEFIEGVAVNASMSRLDLFAMDGSSHCFAAVERALSKIMDLLPHTPIGGVGCNFRWVDSDASSEALDRFDTPEGLEGNFQVEGRRLDTSIQLDGRMLNFTRANVGAEVQYSFNYHHFIANAQTCSELAAGLISTELAHSSQMMRDIYGYGEHTTLVFNEVELEDEISAPEATN